jgi:hypothetical protein
MLNRYGRNTQNIYTRQNQHKGIYQMVLILTKEPDILKNEIQWAIYKLVKDRATEINTNSIELIIKADTDIIKHLMTMQ